MKSIETIAFVLPQRNTGQIFFFPPTETGRP
jgi:hypothetical protein